MTAVLERTGLAEEVREVLIKVDGLVDDLWDDSGHIGEAGSKACLLGLISFALYGVDKNPRYSHFNPSVPDWRPEAVAVVEALDRHIPSDSWNGLGNLPYRRVYLHNDSRLNSTADVHEFLQGVIDS